VTGDGVIRLAGGGTAGRQITGSLIDVTFAPDGATPTALAARDAGDPSGPLALRIELSDVLTEAGLGLAADRAGLAGDSTSDAAPGRTLVGRRRRPAASLRRAPAARPPTGRSGDVLLLAA